jgi:hypothetical protein
MSDVSSAYIRELQETARCDDIGRNLTVLRKAYRDHMGEKAFNNAIDYKEDALDERRTAQTLMQYQDWTDSELVAGLNWSNKAWFYTFLKGDKTLATIGIVTSAFAGWRAVQYANRSWKHAKKLKPKTLE